MQPVKKVLVVEDNPINRSMLMSILASEYEVLEAENGKEALAVLKQQGEAVSLILLDIVMPVMDGYTFLAAMKQEPSFSSIPVIVTTQSDSESDEVKALAHGATDFVTKPYKPQVILHRVASIINLRETAAIINLVQYDRLTGLYSKEFFYQKARLALQKTPNVSFDIICSDIENFKLINDIFGVKAGDYLLYETARLYEQFAGEDGISGHLNADQFACLLKRGGEYSDEIFKNFSARLNALPNFKSVIMKWGIYPVTDETIPIEQMCDRALWAAKSIKGQYGKYFALYDDTLRSRLLREQTITGGMENALRTGAFEVYFQPKYDLKRGRLIGAEALARWNHLELGALSPAEFIPIFERNGFITKMDHYVWEKTCAIIRDWDDKGLPPISISVNVSRADIHNADLEKELKKILHKYRLEPARLHLEITESAYTEYPRQIIEVVGRLRGLGFIIEMDDFGSGYSSLNMLNEMPIDILKLDMKFVQIETAKPNDEGILQFVISLARQMNLKVVAEGVETLEQLKRLRDMGCDYAQGYYYAKPMPYREFERLLENQHDVGEDKVNG